MKRAAWVLAFAVVLSWLASLPALGQRAKPAHARSKKAPLSKAVRDMPTLSFKDVRVRVAKKRRLFPPSAKRWPSTVQSDAAAQSGFGPAVPTTRGVDTNGLGHGTLSFAVVSVPPDTDGAVGRTQYVQVVNTAFAVFDKLTMTKLTGPTETRQLWSSLPSTNPCSTTNDGDALVLYDQLADRWIISQFANAAATTAPWYECVAISQTGDATGQYFLYYFSYSEFPDYPKMGVWPDAYYVSYNTFPGVGPGTGGKLCALDRTNMLNGAATRGVPGPYGAGGRPAGNNQICFRIADFGVLPSHLDGSTLPPPGSPNFGMEWFDTANLGLWRFHVDFARPTNSTLNGTAWFAPDGPARGAISRILIPVTSFTPTCVGTGSQSCVPQLGTAQRLDSLTDRLMHRLTYRNFGTHESLLMNHTVDVDGQGGVRWYEVQNPSGTPTVAQAGTWSPDAAWRWMASMAMDKFGNIAMGYSKSSSSMYPAIAYTTRLSTDTPGTMGDEVILKAGTGSPIPAPPAFPDLDRWGDYTTMSIDPQDDCTFWYTAQYLAADGNFNWQTRIASFKLAQCDSEAFNLSVTPSTGSGASQAFNFLYSDTAGGTKITTAEGMVNTTASTASACAFRYNEDANTIQLYLDDGVSFSAPGTPGDAGTLSNSQCTVNLPTTSAGTSGNYLVVTVDVTFNHAFAGRKRVYMNVSDSAGATGWQQKGTWTAP